MYILRFESKKDERGRVIKYVIDISFARLDDPDLSKAFIIENARIKQLTLDFEGPRDPFAAKLLALTQVYEWITKNHDKETTFGNLAIQTVFFTPDKAVTGYLHYKKEGEKQERLFGTNIREAIDLIKGWFKSK